MVISKELCQEMMGLALLVLSKNSFVSGKIAMCYRQSKIESKLSARMKTGTLSP